MRSAAVHALLLASCLLIPGVPRARPGISVEYQVKAVFLYHFSQFVSWPKAGRAEAGESFVIGVLGGDPFGEYLDEVVRGERKDGRPIEVRRIRTPGEAAGCDILFIRGSYGDSTESLLHRLGSLPVLTVGESEQFAAGGGMIRFNRRDSRIKLRINLDAVQKADLTVSSKLLRLAEIVSEGRG